MSNPKVAAAISCASLLFSGGLQVSGINNIYFAAVLWGIAAIALIWSAIEWHKEKNRLGKPPLKCLHLILIGLGSALLISVLIGIVIANKPPQFSSSTKCTGVYTNVETSDNGGYGIVTNGGNPCFDGVKANHNGKNGILNNVTR